MPELTSVRPLSTERGYLFKGSADSNLAHHWHSSPERMVLVSGEPHVKYDGQEKAIMKLRTYAYGSAELPHAYCAPGDPCAMFFAFELPVVIAAGDRCKPNKGVRS